MLCVLHAQLWTAACRVLLPSPISPAVNWHALRTQRRRCQHAASSAARPSLALVRTAAARTARPAPASTACGAWRMPPGCLAGLLPEASSNMSGDARHAHLPEQLDTRQHGGSSLASRRSAYAGPLTASLAATGNTCSESGGLAHLPGHLDLRRPARRVVVDLQAVSARQVALLLCSQALDVLGQGKLNDLNREGHPRSIHAYSLILPWLRCTTVMTASLAVTRQSPSAQSKAATNVPRNGARLPVHAVVSHASQVPCIMCVACSCVIC